MEIKYRANPNYRSNNSTGKIMLHLTIGLLVIYAFGLFNAYRLGKVYFVNTIILLVTAVVCALAAEAIWALVIKKNVLNYLKNSFGWVTAIILVLCVTYDQSPYSVGVSTVLAILFGKLVFGGFGQNVFNPAGVGRAIIGTSFAGSKIVDALSGATPVSTLSSAGWLLKGDAFATYLEDFGGIKNLFLGIYESGIGEGSTLLIIAVAIYLVIMKVIDWRIPVTYIGIIFIGTALIGVINGVGINFALAFISTGGIFFGGVFMLTDPVTDPNTRGGRIVFAAIAAICTVLIRLFANLPEGVVFSILIANMLSAVIDKFFDGKQTDLEKRNNIFVSAFVVVMIICVVACGGGLKKSDSYKSIHALPEFDHGKTVAITSGEVKALANSYAGAEVKSHDGNTYQIAAQGYDYTGAKNLYTVTVEDGVITSFAMDKFVDSKGIGDACQNLGFLGQFVGKTIDDEVDVYAGASMTSYSAIAAARVALNGGEIKDDSTGTATFEHGKTVAIKSEEVKALANSYASAEVKSHEGNTFQIAAQGYDYSGAKNLFSVTVENGAITAFTMDKFVDSKGVGDVCQDDTFYAQFVGKTINDSVDVCAGASITSYSAIAAARVALEGGK